MRVSKSAVRLFCVGIVVLTAVATADSSDTTLRWKLKAGQKLGFAVTQATVMKMDFNGNETVTTLKRTADVTWEVKSVDKDGNADVVQTIDRIRFQMASPPPGGNVDTDTANEKDAPDTAKISKLFRTIARAQSAMKVTPRGEIRDFTAPAKLVEALKIAVRDARMLGDQESLRNPCSQSLVIFPDATIAQGKSWTAFRRISMPFGTIVLNNTFTREGATGSLENIGFDAKTANVEPVTGLQIEVKSQQVKGHCHFDSSVGVLKSSDEGQKLSMVMTLGGHEIPTELELTMKMELKKTEGEAHSSRRTSDGPRP
jgi:hypothetical protein